MYSGVEISAELWTIDLFSQPLSSSPYTLYIVQFNFSIYQIFYTFIGQCPAWLAIFSILMYIYGLYLQLFSA